MKKPIILVIVFIAIVSAFAGAFANASEAYEAKNLDDVHAASCRVVCSRAGSRTGSIGTGTVVLLAEDKYWILTNWHVIQGWTSYRLDFFRDGQIKSVRAQLQKSFHNEKAPYDFAILTVPVNELASYNPPIVPLGGSHVKPQTDRPIFSAGCSEGRWSMAWKGFVENYFGTTAQFYPAPKSGQSGSAIVQEINGKLQVTGVLTWRVGDEKTSSEENMRGGAIPIKNLFAAISGRAPASMQEGNSIPPHASFCVASANEEKKDNEVSPIDRVWPVMDSNTYFQPVGKNFDGLILFAFCANGCAPCDTAKPILKKLQNDGYRITILNADDGDEGTEITRSCNVSAFPTFLLCSDNGSEYKALERWSGIEFLESRIRHVFAKHVKEKLPPAPTPKQEDTAARRRKLPSDSGEIQPPVESDGAKGLKDGQGGSGDVSPLLDFYGGSDIVDKSPDNDPSGNSAQKQPVPNSPIPKPQQGLFGKRLPPVPDEGNQSGLLGNAADKLSERIQSQIDKVTENIEKNINVKIDEFKGMAQETIKTWLAKVFWTAVSCIIALWYAIYWILKGVRLAVSNLPKIRIERNNTKCN